MKRFMFFSVCALVCLLCGRRADCQIVGGRANGQQAPEEAKAGSVRSGNYQGDVNLFNGTYSSSHSIGSVSTPTGLSFTAMLTYGGSFSGGSEVPFVSGIPYGEGWNLSVPSISVNVSAFHKYTEQQIAAAYNLPNGPFANCSPTSIADSTDCFYLSGQDLLVEGELFYYSPMLSIPGVVSGRLVFKGIDHYYKREPSVSGSATTAAVFTLHSFDDVFVTAYYRDGEWDVRLPNGYRYLFNRGQGSVYGAENYRVKPNSDKVTYPSGVAERSTTPKGVATVWYVGSISNLNLDGDDILFDYETFGCFDYYKEFAQEGLGSAVGGGNILGGLKSCREVFLKSIRAKSGSILIERLDLEYESLRSSTITGDYSGDMLLLGQVGVHRKDSLYNYKSVWFQGQGSSTYESYTPVYVPNAGETPPQLSNWKRFPHVMAGDALYNEFFASPSNPYLFQGGGNAYYKPQSAPASGGGVSVSFDHGFLESPKINPNSLPNNNIMPVGDIMEVRTFINSTTDDPQWDFCNFDINIVSGHLDNGFQSGNLYTNDYDAARNISLFSTFNQAIKWNPLAGNNSTMGHLYTSNFFSMPNIPSNFGGFYIQVGAANSDNKFDLDMTVGNYVCLSPDEEVIGPNTFKSYSYWLVNEGNAPLKPFQRMPNNFGVGLPWHLVHERYDALDDTGLGDLFCSPSPKHYSFWWNETPLPEFPNRPTLTDNFALNSVELIRYSKNPYMLKRATHYKVNGLVASGEEDGLKKVGQYEMEYSVKNCTYYDAPSDNSSYIPKNYSHHNIVLSAIKEVPVNPTGEAGNGLSVAMPTTRFEYETMLCHVPLQTTLVKTWHLSDVVVLKRIVSPIGGVTELVYSDLDNSAFVWSYVDSRLYQNPDEATDVTYELYNQPIQLKIMPRVAEKVVYGKDNADKRRWMYTYQTKRVYNDCFTLGDPMLTLGSSTGVGGEHFSPDVQSNMEIGYVQTTVTEPGLTGTSAPPVSVYVHYTDTLGGLLFGKLKEVRKLMPGGSLLEVTSFRYEALLANAGKRALDGCSSFMDGIAGGVMPALGDRKVRFMEFYLRGSVNGSVNSRYLNSYFTKLVRQSVVKYHANPLPAGGTFHTQTITEYEYFDAYVATPTQNNNRVTTSEGFGLLYAMYGEAEGMNPPPYNFPSDYPLPLPTLSAANSSFESPFIAWGDPSWQLFAVKTYSPQQPDAYTRTEKLYYWDLLCMPAFIDDTVYLATQDFMALRFMQRYHLRNLMYEERQIVKASGKEPVFNATYYEYDMRWGMPRDITPVPTNFPVVIDPVVTPPCPVLPSDVDEALAFGCYPASTFGLQGIYHVWDDDIPDVYGYEPHWFTYGGEQHLYYCAMSEAPAGTWEGLEGYIATHEPGNELGFYNIEAPLSRSIFLRRISASDIEVADDAPTVFAHDKYYSSWLINPNTGLFEGDDVFGNSLPTPITAKTPHFIELYEVHERNRFGQVALEEKNGDYWDSYASPLTLNQSGLFTRFYYSGFRPVIAVFTDADEVPLAGYECYGENGDLVSFQFDIGVPIGMTVGWQSPELEQEPLNFDISDTLHYVYEYYPDYSIKQITDPNGVRKSFSYDVFGRLKGAFLNDQKLTGYSYGQWDNVLGDNFVTRTSKNYVETASYTDGDDLSLHHRAYIDPLGRKGYVVSKVFDNSTTDLPSPVASNEVLYDRWDRVVRGYKPRELASGNGLSMPVVNPPSTTAYSLTVYEADQRSRALQNYKYGQSNKKVENVYRQLNGTELFAELGLNATALTEEDKGRIAPLVGGVTADSYAFFATSTIDEDDKQAIEYVNVLGQKVAVRQLIDATTAIYTLFEYDSRGNLVRTINPVKQATTYVYDALGWLVARNSPDAGMVKYEYAKGGGITGQLLAEADAVLNPQGKSRRYDYDRFGRKVRQYVYYETDSTSVETNEKEWRYHHPFVGGDGLLHPSVLPNMGNPGKTKGQLTYSAAYDHEGNLTARFFYCYDNAEARLSRELQQLAAAPITATERGNVFRIDYAGYNRQGSLLREKVYQDGSFFLLQYVYEYDAWNRVKAVYYAGENYPASPNARVKLASFAYDNASGLLRKTSYYSPVGCPNLVIDTIGYGYDVRNRLARINSKFFDWQLYYDANLPEQNGDSPVADACYNGNINASRARYKLNGMIISGNNHPFGYQTTVYGYKYDGLNRLTAGNGYIPLGAASSYGRPNEIIAYDKVGNIGSLTRKMLNFAANNGSVLQGGTDYAFTYNYLSGGSDNRLGSVLLNGQVFRNYGYDDNGSQTSDEQNNNGVGGYDRSFATVYGRSNLPFRVAETIGTTTHTIGYYYSAGDARYAKVYPVESGGTTVAEAELYVRDAFGRELLVYNNGDNAYTAYAYGTNRFVEFVVMACSNGCTPSGFAFYNHDHLGNTRVVYEPRCANGSLTYSLRSAIDYYPYGKVSREYDEELVRYQSTHNERDRETGYDFRNARSSAGDVVRFGSVDPLEGKYPSWSGYCYVLANPVRIIDPTGLTGYVYNEDGNVIYVGEELPDGVYVFSQYSGEEDVYTAHYVSSLEDFDALSAVNYAETYANGSLDERIGIVNAVVNSNEFRNKGETLQETSFAISNVTWNGNPRFSGFLQNMEVGMLGIDERLQQSSNNDMRRSLAATLLVLTGAVGDNTNGGVYWDGANDFEKQYKEYTGEIVNPNRRYNKFAQGFLVHEEHTGGKQVATTSVTKPYSYAYETTAIIGSTIYSKEHPAFVNRKK